MDANFVTSGRIRIAANIRHTAPARISLRRRRNVDGILIQRLGKDLADAAASSVAAVVPNHLARYDSARTNKISSSATQRMGTAGWKINLK
jgi:hypothetical protein